MKLSILVLSLFLHAAYVMSRVVLRQAETTTDAQVETATKPEETEPAAVATSITSTSSTSRTSTRISSSSTSSTSATSTRSTSSTSSRSSASTSSTLTRTTTSSSTTSSTTTTDTTSADPAAETPDEATEGAPTSCDDSSCSTYPDRFEDKWQYASRTCEACFVNSAGNQQRACGTCADNPNTYILPNGQYCEACASEGDGERGFGNWNSAGNQCAEGTETPIPSVDGRPNICFGSGAPPVDVRCYDYCNSMAVLSRTDSTACRQSFVETYNKCNSCDFGGGPFRYNPDGFEYMPTLMNYCKTKLCLDIKDDSKVYGGSCGAAPGGPSSARRDSSTSSKGSSNGSPVTTGGKGADAENSMQAGASGSVSAGQANNPAGTAVDQMPAKTMETAAVKTITNSNGQVLGTIVVDSSGKTASQVFAVSTTDAAGFPTLSFTTSTLTATFIPNTRFGVVLDTSTATSSAAREQVLPRCVLHLLTGALAIGSLQSVF